MVEVSCRIFEEISILLMRFCWDTPMDSPVAACLRRLNVFWPCFRTPATVADVASLRDRFPRRDWRRPMVFYLVQYPWNAFDLSWNNNRCKRWQVHRVRFVHKTGILSFGDIEFIEMDKFLEKIYENIQSSLFDNILMWCVSNILFKIYRVTQPNKFKYSYKIDQLHMFNPLSKPETLHAIF